MFHERQINNKIKKLNERALWIAHIDTVMSFEELLIEDKTLHYFTIHHQNIQSLTIETYKAVNHSPAGNLSDFFCKK